MRSLLPVVLLLATVSGCKRETTPPPDAARPVRFFQLFLQGADERSPLVVAIHGRGDTPEHFADLMRELPAKAQVALPQAFTPFSSGFSWFHWPPGMSDDALAQEVGAAEEKLWPAIAELAKGRKVIVTGFSQGGVLSFALAARHPYQITAAFPVSGGSPHKLLPREGGRAAPVFAMHGTDDRLVNIELARSAVAGFKKAGASAELKEFPGVGHTVTEEMRALLYERIVTAIR